MPAQHFVSRPDTAWIGRGTAFSAPSPSDVAPCWWSGTPSRRNPGSSSPTLRPIRWDPAGMRSASGSSWASRPSRAWAGNGTRPAAQHDLLELLRKRSVVWTETWTFCPNPGEAWRLLAASCGPGVLVDGIMDAEVSAQIGAEHGERSSAPHLP